MSGISEKAPRGGAGDLEVVWREPGLLKPARRNARTHSERQIAQIMGSIEQFGFTNPVLLDGENGILAGHGRVEAAKRLGLTRVPTIALSHLSAVEQRVYALTDNKLALNSGWDEELLRIELGSLGDMDLGFEIDLTGFSTPEVDLLMAQDGGAGKTERDDITAAPMRWSTVQPGDLWTLGNHRLLCGDSREPASFATLMSGDLARMVFSDPPYNVRIDGHVGGLGAIKHQEFAMASGEMSAAEFAAFLELAFRNAAAVSVEGALHYQCMDWRHINEMMKAGEAAYSELKNVCVWAKDNGGMGSFYRSQHEFVFVWKVGTAPHLNNVELGKNGRYRTNVWDYRAATKTGRNAELSLHPTVKPVAMVADAIKDASNRGDIVLDAFGGSGSTLMAADREGRRARLIEYEGGYCDVTIQRWQGRRRQQAMLVETGETFDEVKVRRDAELELMADRALEMA